MTSIYKSSLTALIFVAMLVCGIPQFAIAQNSVSFSVSPTIFDMTASPGQTWRSSIRVINSNQFDLKVFVKVVNFVPKGESGVPQFIPIEEYDSSSATFAQWIATDSEVTVPAEKTFELPLTIVVPDDAAPGGHFAAVMISTTPPKAQEGDTKVETAQVISSLLFLRVTGEVEENASLRSFRTTHLILSKPEATFELRIKNDGNVHVQPQGEITITNMWGQQRGVIAVNQQTLFGNVLPKSVRKYAFNWSGEWSIGDIGRYTAVASLAYGSDSRQSMYATTHFWLVPWKPILFVLIVLGSFISLFVWAIRLYVRRMLTIAGVSVEPNPAPLRESLRGKQVSVAAPLEAGILDLRSRLKDTEGVKMSTSVVFVFIKAYKTFFLMVGAILIFALIVTWFIQEASEPSRDFEVTYPDQGAAQPKSQSGSEQPLVVQVVNQTGGDSDFALSVTQIKNSGYTVEENSDGSTLESENTSIVYRPQYAKEALALSEILDGALLSAFDSTDSSSAGIVVYLGKDINQN